LALVPVRSVSDAVEAAHGPDLLHAASPTLGRRGGSVDREPASRSAAATRNVKVRQPAESAALATQIDHCFKQSDEYTDDKIERALIKFRRA
jgi:hypothetical protein